MTKNSLIALATIVGLVLIILNTVIAVNSFATQKPLAPLQPAYTAKPMTYCEFHNCDAHLAK